MKELKNKEIIIGLAALIVLCIIAIVLIIKRESGDDKVKDNVASVEEIAIEAEEAEAAEDEPLLASMPEELNNLGITEEESQTEIEKGEIISTTKVGEAASFHTEPKLKEYKGEEMWQLEEIFHYWMDYKLEAVDDLIHLPRVRTITNELKGSNDFYYYGHKDSKGNPSGSGLAVYADNTYYCGEWKDGKRHGKGMWWKIFPDKTGTVNGVPGVTAHSYNGTWANDYPNGEGQEHFDYDYSLIEGDYVITNVIGNFKDGYYDGELYIMTEQGENSNIDWEAEAERGVYKHCSPTPNVLGKFQVWERMTMTDDENENYRLMYDKDNKGFGIYGLKMKD